MIMLILLIDPAIREGCDRDINNDLAPGEDGRYKRAVAFIETWQVQNDGHLAQ